MIKTGMGAPGLLLALVLMQLCLPEARAEDVREKVAAIGPSSVLQAGVRKQECNEHCVSIDENRLRRIGGNDPRIPPTRKFIFNVENDEAGNAAVLTIGYLARPASMKKPPVAGPTVIKVNGVKVAYLWDQTDPVRLPVPAKVLKPGTFNTMQIEAGYYIPETNRIAYDGLEFRDLFLLYEPAKENGRP